MPDQASKPLVRKRSRPTAGSAAALARIRRICAKLPNTSEKEAWGAPTFRLGGRLFAMFSDNHHNDGILALWLAAPPGAQAAFISSDQNLFFKPPYVGPSGWLGVRLDRKAPGSLIAELLAEAHRTIAEKSIGRQKPVAFRAPVRSSGGGATKRR